MHVCEWQGVRVASKGGKEMVSRAEALSRRGHKEIRVRAKVETEI
jgi:hypothetical protein